MAEVMNAIREVRTDADGDSIAIPTVQSHDQVVNHIAEGSSGQLAFVRESMRIRWSI